MGLLFNNQYENKKRVDKEVKKMKRGGLLVLIMALLFFAGATKAFALPTIADVSTTRRTAIHVEYLYNPYGIGAFSEQKSTTTTSTARTITEGGLVKTMTETDVSISVSASSWRGGSLKVDSVKNAVNPNDPTKTLCTGLGSDGSNSQTTFSTNYVYDQYGRLSSANGKQNTSSVDDKGDASSSETINTYTIRRGEAIVASSVTNATSFGEGSIGISNTVVTNTYTYSLRGGAYLQDSVTSDQITNGITGTSGEGNNTHIKTITTYARNANGLVTGLTQSKPIGTMQTRDINTGAVENFVMASYTYNTGYDAKAGFYVKTESWDWNPV